MGARFPGHGGLRVNAALARASSSSTSSASCAGELPVVWSSPLVPAELLAALGIGSVKPEASRRPRRGRRRRAPARARGRRAAERRLLQLPARRGRGARRPARCRCRGRSSRRRRSATTARSWAAYLGHKHGRPSFLVDVPAAGGAAAERYVVEQLRELVGVLEGIAGRALEPGRLAAAVRESNRARAHWLEANRLRREHPPVAYGAASLRLTGGPLLQKLGLPETAEAMSDYAAEIRERIDAGGVPPGAPPPALAAPLPALRRPLHALRRGGARPRRRLRGVERRLVGRDRPARPAARLRPHGSSTARSRGRSSAASAAVLRLARAYRVGRRGPLLPPRVQDAHRRLPLRRPGAARGGASRSSS